MLAYATAKEMKKWTLVTVLIIMSKPSHHYSDSSVLLFKKYLV